VLLPSHSFLFLSPSLHHSQKELAVATNLKVSQVNYWFINARVRIWKPMIESMEVMKATGAEI
jgi:Homeobox KN domain